MKRACRVNRNIQDPISPSQEVEEKKRDSPSQEVGLKRRISPAEPEGRIDPGAGAGAGV